MLRCGVGTLTFDVLSRLSIRPNQNKPQHQPTSCIPHRRGLILNHTMKPWREASTLIVLARQRPKPDTIAKRTNYNILFQKRITNASSFPNSVVFPGGVTEESDFSDNWFDYFKSCGIKEDQFDALYSKTSKIAPIFENNLKRLSIRPNQNKPQHQPTSCIPHRRGLILNHTMKPWREASTLIVLARQRPKPDTIAKRTNYNILFQKRITNASSFPNSVVFPGGVTEESDFSDNWFDYFKSCGIKEDQFDALYSKTSKIAPIFENNLKRHVGFRMTAIRETFEELGVLLCNHKTRNVSTWATALKDFDVKEWQVKVHKNSEEFFQLCQTLECYPNIWALNYWSNWLTPHNFKKRFHTPFFITAFHEAPQVALDESEVAGYKWATIEDVLEQNARRKIELQLPQCYELMRMLRHKDLDQLVQYSAEVDSSHADVYCPITIIAQNGIAHVLPGDDLYPKNMDLNKDYTTKEDRSIEELRRGCATLHRFEKTTDVWELFSNKQS